MDILDCRLYVGIEISGLSNIDAMSLNGAGDKEPQTEESVYTLDDILVGIPESLRDLQKLTYERGYHLEPYIKPENPLPYTLDLARQHLIKEPEELVRKGADPRQILVPRNIEFAYRNTARHAYQAFLEDLNTPNGFWLPVVQSVVRKVPKDFIDYEFLATFRKIMSERPIDIEVGIDFAVFYAKNIKFFEQAFEIISVFQDQRAEDADYFDKRLTRARSIAMADESIDPNLRDYLIKYTAGSGLESFLGVYPDGSKSIFPVYHNIGRCLQGIDVASPNWWDWIKYIEKAISIVTDEDSLKTQFLHQQIGDKFVRDVTAELVRLKDGVGRDNPNGTREPNYDIELRYAVCWMLYVIGIDKASRQAIYERIPGFKRLPSDNEHIFWMPRIDYALQVLQGEFSDE